MFIWFASFLHTDTTQVVEVLLHVRQELIILHSQYHRCWYLSDVRSQGINNYDIDYVEPK